MMQALAKGVLGLLFGANLLATAHANDKYPFQNPALPIEERIDNILSLMTRDEKVACLGRNPGVPRLGIDGSGHVEGLHGLALGGPGGWGRQRPIATTQFPQAIGMAETWDPGVIRAAGAVEGYEARYVYQNHRYNGPDFRDPNVIRRKGGLVIRAPNADLGRDIRWGRNEECYGEDPFLCGTMAAAMVHGLQGDDPRYWQTAALMKHFLANSNENGRGHTSSDFDERLLHEYYSMPFRMGVVDGGSRCYMAAYNAYNGIPCTVQPILREVTIDQWGLDGIICTDAGAYRMLVGEHKYYPDLNQAMVGVIKAGISQFLDRYDEPLHEVLDSGALSEADLDRVLRGNFRVMIRLGMLDPPEMVPYRQIQDGPEPWLSDKHRAIARQVTQKSIVLLKNDALLPLDRRKIKSIAVIGPSASEVFLDWYSGTPPYAVSPLDGIRDKVGPGVRVSFAANNTNNVASIIAGLADVAIVCVGNHPTGNAPWAKCPTPSDGKEAIDRRSIELEQEQLVKEIYRANKNTVVVLVSSFPFAINWTEQHVPAIVHMAHNSQETGHALADVLFGDYNPAGRLVQTWPRSEDDLPPMLDYNIRHGRTYMYLQKEPLYPFGHGLSYTTFEYSNLRTDADALDAGGGATVSVDVKNTGDLAGDEVVQLYVRHLDSKVDRPQQELRGFRRVHVEPGATQTVQIPLAAASLAYWNADDDRFEVESDRVEIQVGSSSADIRLKTELAVNGK
jgi:beta-glucosidase